MPRRCGDPGERADWTSASDARRRRSADRRLAECRCRRADVHQTRAGRRAAAAASRRRLGRGSAGRRDRRPAAAVPDPGGRRSAAATAAADAVAVRSGTDRDRAGAPAHDAADARGRRGGAGSETDSRTGIDRRDGGVRAPARRSSRAAAVARAAVTGVAQTGRRQGGGRRRAGAADHGSAAEADQAPGEARPERGAAVPPAVRVVRVVGDADAEHVDRPEQRHVAALRAAERRRRRRRHLVVLRLRQGTSAGQLPAGAPASRCRHAAAARRRQHARQLGRRRRSAGRRRRTVARAQVTQRVAVVADGQLPVVDRHDVDDAHRHVGDRPRQPRPLAAPARARVARAGSAAAGGRLAAPLVAVLRRGGVGVLAASPDRVPSLRRRRAGRRASVAARPREHALQAVRRRPTRLAALGRRSLRRRRRRTRRRRGPPAEAAAAAARRGHAGDAVRSARPAPQVGARLPGHAPESLRAAAAGRRRAGAEAAAAAQSVVLPGHRRPPAPRLGRRRPQRRGRAGDARPLRAASPGHRRQDLRRRRWRAPRADAATAARPRHLPGRQPTSGDRRRRRPAVCRRPRRFTLEATRSSSAVTSSPSV